MQDYTDIIFSISDLVATIAINRPKVLNAFNQVTLYEIENALHSASTRRDVGVIVITGVGERAFCAGGDVNWEAEGGLDGVDYKLARLIMDCPKPVIARVNGYAIGGGNHLQYFCDITVAAEHAIFGQNGPRVGSPAAGYLVSHSANILGHKRAREMWMTCRRYTAPQMLEWGLINSVVPMQELDTEVKKWADEMLSLSPTCLKILKASFKHHMDPILNQEMTDIVNRIAPNYFATGEQQEGANAFREKRKPDFNRWR
ncbi:MAG: enoyl-CoA hydratase-related protein [Pseudorhodoplanes sp.]